MMVSITQDDLQIILSITVAPTERYSPSPTKNEEIQRPVHESDQPSNLHDSHCICKNIKKKC